MEDSEHGYEPLLTPGEVARMFHVNPRTVSRWERAGKIRAVRTLGGHRRFFQAEIEGVVEATESRPSNGVG